MYPLSAPHTGPIGVFDSGYGGLTILGKFIERLPQYDYLYLGDNARVHTAHVRFEVVYDFTLQAVKKLFELGCPLVILACNTASAKALRQHPAERPSSHGSDPPRIRSNTPHRGMHR